MTTTAEHWHLNILAQGDRLAAAMAKLHDANAAHLVAHEVMRAATVDLPSPVSRRDLDTALGRAPRLRHASHARIVACSRPPFPERPTWRNSLTAQMKAEESERAALTREDYAAAGVECPDWDRDPIPSLETWRRWQSAQDKALAHKRMAAREGA